MNSRTIDRSRLFEKRTGDFRGKWAELLRRVSSLDSNALVEFPRVYNALKVRMMREPFATAREYVYVEALFEEFFQKVDEELAGRGFSAERSGK